MGEGVILCTDEQSASSVVCNSSVGSSLLNCIMAVDPSFLYKLRASFRNVIVSLMLPREIIAGRVK